MGLEEIMIPANYIVGILAAIVGIFLTIASLLIVETEGAGDRLGVTLACVAGAFYFAAGYLISS